MSQPQIYYATMGIFKDAVPSSEYYTTTASENSSVVLGDYFRGGSSSSVQNNQQQNAIRHTCMVISDKISHMNHKRTLTQQVYNFHCKVADNKYVMIVVADTECPIRICYTFLDDLETQYKRRGFDNEGTMNNHKQVSSIIKDRMAYYNNMENDKISKLKNQIDNTKDVMISNIDKVIERGEKLDVLMDKTADLQDNAFGFKNRSHKLKNVMKKRLVVIALIIVFLLLLIIFFIVWFGCGFPAFERCKIESNNNTPAQ